MKQGEWQQNFRKRCVKQIRGKRVKGVVKMSNKKLKCHTDLKLNKELYITEGKEYIVVEETEDFYKVLGNKEYVHAFTKEIDAEGKSYKTWFDDLEVVS